VQLEQPEAEHDEDHQRCRNVYRAARTADDEGGRGEDGKRPDRVRLQRADDVTAELAGDKIVLSRPGGLTLSTSGLNDRDTAGSMVSPVMFDPQTWGFDREAPLYARQFELIGKAASAPEGKRRAARLNLARFYMARDMIAEAKAVLDVVIADERTGEDGGAVVLRAAANVLLGRTEDALKEVGGPQVGNQNDAPLWRAIAQRLRSIMRAGEMVARLGGDEFAVLMSSPCTREEADRRAIREGHQIGATCLLADFQRFAGVRFKKRAGLPCRFKGRFQGAHPRGMSRPDSPLRARARRTARRAART